MPDPLLNGAIDVAQNAGGGVVGGGLFALLAYFNKVFAKPSEVDAVKTELKKEIENVQLAADNKILELKVHLAETYLSKQVGDAIFDELRLIRTRMEQIADRRD